MRSGQEPGQDFSAVLPPPPPADIDHAWVFEEGLDNGFEDYVTVWRGSLLACTLDVEKRTPALAFREHINAERKRRGGRALPTRRMREWLEMARHELAEAEQPPYRTLVELVKEHATKGVEAEDFRLRNVMSGGIISPSDLLPIAEGFVGVQPDAIEAYVDQVLGGGHQPLIPDPAQAEDGGD